MATARERLAAMDDFQIVRTFDAFAQQLMAGSSTSFDTVQAGVPATTRALTGWRTIEGLTPEQAERLVAPADAAPVARQLLMHLADDPVYGSALESFLSTYRDDALVADVILAVGLVASMVMMMASTTFKAKFGNVEIEKHTVDAGTIKAILEPFSKVIPAAKE